ncbi:hypothetical protein [Peptoniphilus timonensis]|uniref:hypothetical protein n=1 Tax=Peptoniphilus timonensis TaxID=1268254 RepID=UPI0002D46015|nr:hypothetical protein [Peptoniphilus timonensis]
MADFPIATAKDAEEFMTEVQELSKEFADEKKAKSSLERKITKIKTDSEKEIKALKDEITQLKEENQKVKEDESLKKEIEELRKELTLLKNEMKKSK